MGSATLIVDQRGSRLERASPGVVRLTSPDGESQRIGLLGLSGIVVQGDAMLSASLLREAHDAGVAVTLLPGRGPGEPAHLLPFSGHLLRLRLAQYRCHADAHCRLSVARALVVEKIRQQQRWLLAHDAHMPMERFIHAATEAANLESLRGVEGAAAACYFSAWPTLWPQPWPFVKRSRRPPRDPVNAMLSLGYTMAMHHVGRFAGLRGLDPQLGCLHETRPGRPSFSLDLMEPLRPPVDQWVWRFLDQGFLSPDRFTCSTVEGCRLDKEGRAIFYSQWFQTGEHGVRRVARSTLALVIGLWRHHGALAAADAGSGGRTGTEEEPPPP